MKRLVASWGVVMALLASTIDTTAGSIFFGSYRNPEARRGGLYVMREDGKYIRPWIEDPEAFYGKPTWFSDGQRVAFHIQGWGSSDIWIMEVQSGQMRNVVEHLNAHLFFAMPAVSRDGNWIAFSGHELGDPNAPMNIYRIRPDGTDFKRLTDAREQKETNHYATWSPDSERIAFYCDRDGNDEIYAMNKNGTNQTNLTHHPALDSVPAWSPDGERIAFASDRDGNWEVYVMDVDGGNVERLTNSPGWDGAPYWSPDGREIAFHSKRDNNWDIYRLNLETGEVARLTRHPAADLFPVWIPTPPFFSVDAIGKLLLPWGSIKSERIR